MWREAKTLKGRYLINEYGEIKSKITDKILKKQVNIFGYYQVTIRPNINEIKTIRLHTIVAEAFIGEKPKGYVINHKDGNKKNNYYKNLEYVTSSENNIHALKTGLRKPAHNNRYGEKSPKHILKESDVISILKLHYETGFGERKLSKIMNLPRGAICGVISKTRPRWTQIDREKIKEELRKEGKLNGKFS